MARVRRWAVLTLLAGALVGPAVALDPRREVSQYRISAWSPREGLPQASVLAIEQDAEGHLWLGTQEGVGRFDGSFVEAYAVANAPALGHNYVSTIHRDVGGRLWFGTDASTLATWSPAGFVAFDTGDVFRGRVSGIQSDASGTVFVAFHLGGLFRVTDGGLEPVADMEAHGVHGGIGQLVRGARGLWAGARGGAFRQEGSRWTFVPIPEAAGFDVTALVEDSQGRLWVALDGVGAVRRFDPDARPDPNPPPVLDVGPVRSLLVDAAGTLWIGSEAGLLRWREDRPAVTERVPGVPIDSINTLRADPDGSVWAGTNAHGLYRLQSSEVLVIGEPEGLPDNDTWNVFETRDGTFYTTTDGGLVRWRQGRQERVEAPGFPAADVVALGEARDGSLWAGTFRNGLYRSDPAGTSWRAVARGRLPSSPITVAFEDSRGQLWVGTRDGLFRGAGEELNVVSLVSGPGQPYISSILEDPAGTVWVASYGAGLFAFRGQGVERYTLGEGLPSNQLNALHLDAAGRLWVATNDLGIAVLAPPDAQGRRAIGRLGAAQGLPHGLVLWLVEDRAGFLWMSTNHGLVRARLEDLARAALTGQGPVAVRVFDEGDGLRTSELNNTGQPAGARTRDGRVWFPSSAGLVVVDPASLREPTPPRCDLRRIAFDGVVRSRGPVEIEVPPGTVEIEVPPGAGELEVDFAALEFDEPAGTTFRYRLFPLEESWHDAGTSRAARYTNLAPGTYRFEVAARHQDGGPFGTPAAVTFRLTPSWVQSWPFRGLAALAGVALVVALARWRNRRLRALVRRRTGELEVALGREHTALVEAEAARRKAEEATRVKSDFLAVVSHELRTPLHAILGLSDLLLQTPLDGRQRAWGRLVQESGEDLLALVDDLLDISRIEKQQLELRRAPFDLRQALETAMAMAEISAAEKGLALAFEFTPPGPYPVLGDERRVRQVLNNLLSNAIKFTDQGSVTVRAEVHEGGSAVTLDLIVQDTGAGISAEAQEAIFEPFVQGEAGLGRRFGGVGLGLAISHRLVQAMNGSITVQSAPGKGATFHVRLHLDRTTLPMAEAPAASTAPPRAKSLRILTVEDDAVNRLVAKAMLHSLGHDSDFVEDGIAALDAAAKAPYDVLLLDLQLPGLDGIEVARRLRQADPQGGPWIIALTANALPEQRARCLAAGMNDFLTKPLRPEDLAAALERAVSGRELLRHQRTPP